MQVRIFPLFVLLLFYACTTTREAMDSWMGSTAHSLVMSWGAPARTASDENGGKILIWADEVYVAPRNSTFYDSYGGSQTTYIPGEHYWKYKMFYVNSSGIIYSWRTETQSIPPSQVDVNLYVR